jgi:hypothetical protein
MCWLAHWLMMYSFTSKQDILNNGLFATVLTDASYGPHFLRVVQMRSKNLCRYMISSILISRAGSNPKYQIGKDVLEQKALPIALQLLTTGSDDVFATFLKTLYEDYDIEAALALVDKMDAVAKGDLLLSGFAADIKREAYILVF